MVTKRKMKSKWPIQPKLSSQIGLSLVQASMVPGKPGFSNFHLFNLNLISNMSCIGQNANASNAMLNASIMSKGVRTYSQSSLTKKGKTSKMNRTVSQHSFSQSRYGSNPGGQSHVMTLSGLKLFSSNVYPL